MNYYITVSVLTFFVFRFSNRGDSFLCLDAEMKKFDPGIYRKPTVPMKTFLLEQRQVGPLEGTKLDLVERFSNAYEHARHDPKVTKKLRLFLVSLYTFYEKCLKITFHLRQVNEFSTVSFQLWLTIPSTFRSYFCLVFCKF